MYLKAKRDCISSVRRLRFKAFNVYSLGVGVLELKNPIYVSADPYKSL